MGVERVGPPVRIVDNGDPGFGAGVGWLPLLFAGAFQGDLRACVPNAGAGRATWTFGGLAPGLYRVLATWLGHELLAGAARFTVRGGADTLGGATVDQRAGSSGFADAGALWQDLGFVYLGAGALVVELSDLADGYLLADAVRVERVL